MQALVPRVCSAPAERRHRQPLAGWLEFAGISVRVVRGFSSQSYADVVHDRVARE
ncbi:hypothetical protein ACFCZ2_30005 [Streptomyces sp. NPDC056202]|uniref:hypothetical protein n=1 Tax=unclassified Streptomyces TaxID=2593676 RepID=UPI0035DAD8DF